MVRKNHWIKFLHGLMSLCRENTRIVETFNLSRNYKLSDLLIINYCYLHIVNFSLAQKLKSRNFFSVFKVLNWPQFPIIRLSVCLLFCSHVQRCWENELNQTLKSKYLFFKFFEFLYIEPKLLLKWCLVIILFNAYLGSYWDKASLLYK